MSQFDDIKAQQAEVLQALADNAVAVGNIATDIDTLLGLVGGPNPDLDAIAASMTEIRDKAVAQRDALKAVDAKYPKA